MQLLWVEVSSPIMTETPATDPDPDDLLTGPEAAALLGMSVRTVERLRNAGVIQCVRTGRKPRVYYLRPDILAYRERVNALVVQAAQAHPGSSHD